MKCYLCDSETVVNESCAKCSQPYCADDASTIDPGNYCDECMQDVVIEETVYTKTKTNYNPEKDTINVQKSSCKQILFKGIDWMFNTKRISELPDEEVIPILNYHRGCVYQLESELAYRAVKKDHLQVTNHNGRRVIDVQTQTRVKSVKTAKVTPKATATVEQLVQLALKYGIDDLAVLMEYINKSKIQ